MVKFWNKSGVKKPKKRALKASEDISSEDRLVVAGNASLVGLPPTGSEDRIAVADNSSLGGLPPTGSENRIAVADDSSLGGLPPIALPKLGAPSSIALPKLVPSPKIGADAVLLVPKISKEKEEKARDTSKTRRARLQFMAKRVARERTEVIQKKTSNKEEYGELLQKMQKKQAFQNEKNKKGKKSVLSGVPMYSKTYLRRQAYPVMEYRMTDEFIPNSPPSRAEIDEKRANKKTKTKEQLQAEKTNFWDCQAEFLDPQRLENWKENMNAMAAREAEEKRARAAYAAKQAQDVCAVATSTARIAADAAELAVEDMRDRLVKDPRCFDEIRAEVYAKEEMRAEAKRKRKAKKQQKRSKAIHQAD
jgi:hypothetical protein